ncbi:MAG TPA: type II toxin-antitoxin system VapB family antitoxin [Candidatus Angelobacter sp.]|nr:type II toxin-antitoxin system VapB family antitoxin [Candidatus Angelobacter sp.]
MPASGYSTSLSGDNSVRTVEQCTKICEVRDERNSSVRITLEIDNELMRQAMRCSGTRFKKAAVEAGLRLLIQVHAQTAIRRLKGKVRWKGDLDSSRLGRLGK